MPAILFTKKAGLKTSFFITFIVLLFYGVTYAGTENDLI